MFNLGNIFGCPTTTLLGAIAGAITLNVQPTGNHTVDTVIACVLTLFGLFSNKTTANK